MKRRLARPVSGSSKISVSSRRDCSTSSSWSTLVRAGGGDPGHELAVGDRLDEEVLDAAVQGRDRGLEVERLALEQHDGGAEGLRVALDRLQQRVAAGAAAQVHVDDRHVGRRPAADRDRLVGRLGLGHDVSDPCQGPSQLPPSRRISVRQHHPHGPGVTLSRRRHASIAPNQVQTRRVSTTSRSICSIRASTVSKRCSPRSRSMNSSASVRP